MTRGLWDRFMIVLMGIVIFFGMQELWRSAAPLGEGRYLFTMGLAVVVIVLKVQALRKGAASK